MVIAVSALVSGCDTNAQGDIVRNAILEALRTEQVIEVSFTGFNSTTTSFVNSAFVELLSSMSIDQIKEQIRVTGSSSQINDLIKKRLIRDADRFIAA